MLPFVDRLWLFETEVCLQVADTHPALDAKTDDVLSSRNRINDRKLLRVHGNGVARKGVEAIELKLKGYEATEIAKHYDTSVNNVNAWISRARSKLRNEPALLEILY